MYKRGSLTIELSLLMPAIFSVLIILIFAGFFFHDRCVIERGVCAALIKLSDERQNASIIFHDEVDNRLLGVWNMNEEFSVSDGKITVHIIGQMNCIEGIFTRYLSKMIFKVDITESAYLLNAPEYIRSN